MPSPTRLTSPGRGRRHHLALPPDRFPALVALGEHVWVDNRDERFTAGLDVLVDGLKHARNSPSDQRPEADRRPPPQEPDDTQQAAAEPRARR